MGGETTLYLTLKLKNVARRNNDQPTQTPTADKANPKNLVTPHPLSTDGIPVKPLSVPIRDKAKLPTKPMPVTPGYSIFLHMLNALSKINLRRLLFFSFLLLSGSFLKLLENLSSSQNHLVVMNSLNQNYQEINTTMNFIPAPPVIEGTTSVSQEATVQTQDPEIHACPTVAELFPKDSTRGKIPTGWRLSANSHQGGSSAAKLVSATWNRKRINYQERVQYPEGRVQCYYLTPFNFLVQNPQHPSTRLIIETENEVPTNQIVKNYQWHDITKVRPGFLPDGYGYECSNPIDNEHEPRCRF